MRNKRQQQRRREKASTGTDINEKHVLPATTLR